MTNKVVIGILIFLVVLSGGLCAYSYTLGQQIKALSVQLGVYQKEQSAQIGAVSDRVTTIRREALVRIDTLDGEMATLEDGIATLAGEIGTLEDEMDGTLIKVGTLEHEMRDIATELPQSVINADRVYQRVRNAVVRVSDGERTIGSGFMIDTAGHVVTAHHVVERLSTIYVVLSDGRSSKATVAGSCEYSDIAVLTLDDKRLVVESPTLADSVMVRIGEPVVTVGSPFELTETLTSGIVSQTGRFAEIRYGLRTRWVANLIQFDAAVNFGNSGGPLLNSKGEVIGMVIARVDPNEGDGIYYAVSSNKVKRVATSLIDQGFFDYPWLGVEIANLTPEIMQDRVLETTNGVLVNRVLPDSPARVSGIKVDDIIVAIDAVAVRDVGDLNSYLGEHKSPDELVSLTLIRNTTKLEVSLRIGKRRS